MDIEVCYLPGGFPFPSPAELRETETALAGFDAPDRAFLFDGLAFGAMPSTLISVLKGPIVALVHHPLGLEAGLDAAQSESLLRCEREALAFARHIIVPSRATADALSELFGVDGNRITVAEPGVSRGPRAAGTPAGQPLHIVSVGAVTPRKGFSVFADALNGVRDLDWRATIAGSLDRSPESVLALRAKIAGYGLEDRVTLAGPMNETALSVLYASGDIFALATQYEGYGMVFAEAMAHGLPIVASGEGAVRDTVPETAGLLCETGNAAAFADGLRRLLGDRSLREAKAQGAWEHGQTLPKWQDTATIIADVLAGVSR
jgi:glycosyltransferase involved in cell wall biosynthesis